MDNNTKSRRIGDDIVRYLAEVDRHMSEFQGYVKTQKDNDKPLYQWSKFAGYAALGTAVSQLEEATAQFKTTHLPQASLAASVRRATRSSTSISKAAVYVLSVMNAKTGDYMVEMKKSTLCEEAKMNANVLITKEIQTLLKQTTRAVEHVWHATDLLRECKQSRTQYKNWAWSVAGTVMTATIATVVGILTAHIYGPAGMNLITRSGFSGGMYAQVLDLVQRTQAVTNLTGEICTIKLQDVEQRYNNLASLSDSHGLRIDNLVDGLGPPNNEGTYYLSTPKEDNKSCKSCVRAVSKDLNRQLYRQHEELETMRKNMHRMDIRLTRSIEKVRKA
jgi:hypothetical protein